MRSSNFLIQKSHRVTASVLAFLFLTFGLVAVANPYSASAADPVMSLSSTTTSAILAGDTSTITLKATNTTTTTDLYNLSFSEQLPVGVSYKAGSTTPTTIGNPQIITVVDDAVTDPLNPVTHQVLIWSNVSDLVAANESGITFEITADPAKYPVGSNYAGTSNAYAQSDPRILPKFNTTTGAAIPASYTNSDSQTPSSTKVSAIKITKTNPNPETELMRGVHAQTSTFTLKIQNTTQGATNNAVVTDYLPAQLEFLSCGGVDNSSAPEYTGAPSLTATPTIAANCPTPASVNTITNPAGLSAGVYTEVRWNLGTLAAGQTRTITYAVGIPLYANTDTFVGGKPSATSLAQASNLNNNSGASTRQINNGQAYTNTATATGDYTGLIVTGGSVAQTSTATNTVKSMDLDIVETASTGNFNSGTTFDYNLMVRTSEYATSSGIVVTDTVPNGICPLIPVGTTVIGTMPADCTANAPVTGGTMTSVTVNADGTFSLTFTLTNATLATNTTTNLKYKALFRGNYEGSIANPTASGDTFSNKAGISGTSTAVAATGVTPATQPVTDGSGTTQSASTPTIEKLVLPRTNVSNAADCKTHAGQYVDETAVTPNFVLGDRVCFQLKVTFSTTSETRNSKITDFAPVGTTYEGYSVGGTSEGSTVPAGDVSAPTIQTPTDGSSTIPTWKLGHTEGSDTTNLFINKGSVLVLYVSAIVKEATTKPAVDITANLMKYTQQNTGGTVLALRDSADFGIAPAPTMTLVKNITNVNGTAQPANTTSATVRGTNPVLYSLVAKNTGSVAVGNDQTINDTKIWDALPTGVNCSMVSLITPTGVCTDNYSDLTGSDAGKSAIVWTIAGGLAADASTTLTYRVDMPALLNASTAYVNKASIVSFQIENTAGTSDTTFYPTDSLDTANAAKQNTAAANGSTTLNSPAVTVAKSVTSPVLANNTATQAVNGELVNYTYSITVPARTTVYNGVITDNLPSGLIRLGTTTYADTFPAGSTNNYVAGTGYVTTLPATYSNSTAADQTFTVTLTGVQVSPTAATGTIVNSATFTSKVTLGGTDVVTAPRTATLTVVAPLPTLVKTVASSGAIAAGATLTYTLTTNNTNGRPTGYDTTVIDCLPAGLSYVADVTPLPTGVTHTAPNTAGTGVSGAGSNGCAVNTTRIQYEVGNLLPATPLAIRFTATVDPTATGSVAYTNSATVNTSTLADGTQTAATEGIKSATGTVAVTINGATVVKTTTKAKATIGETVPYRIVATIPANTNFYNASIIDTLPTGVAIDTSSAVITCEDAVTGVACSPTITATPLAASGQKYGWYLGNLNFSGNNRLITVTFNGTITDVVGNTTGTVESNVGVISWNIASGAAPANAGATFTRSSATSTATTTVTQPALSIAKTTNNSTPEPDGTFNYTVTTTNSNAANASTAYNVTVTDTVPTGVVVDAATISNGGTITGQTVNGGGVISWTVSSLATGATTTFTYSAKLADSTTLTAAGLTNTARVTTYASLATGGRIYTTPAPTATAVVTPKFPSVSLSKTPTSGTVAYVNKPFGWTLKATNAVGAAVAQTVTATDTLPVNWTYDANSAFVVNPSTGISSQVEPTVTTTSGVQELVWVVGPFAANQTATITYTATPSSDALTAPGLGQGNAHTNTLSAVTKDAAGYDHNFTRSYTGAPVSANAYIGSADLEVKKTLGGTMLAGGASVPDVWKVVVKNNGPDTAVGAFTVTDTMGTLPSGVTVLSATGTGWSCTVPNTDGDFTCERVNANETLANGASFPVINVSARAAASTEEGSTVENTVAVSALTTDINLTNNTDSATTTITASSDLSIVKTTSGTVRAGQTATWNIAVNASGPSTSHSPVTVTDTLPAGVLNATASGTGWVCAAPVAGEIVCTTGDLIGNAAPITVTADIPSSFTGDVVNTATVSSGTTDPTPANNTDDATATVNTETSISVQKSLTSGDIVAGKTAVYRFDVNNTGLADARNIVITDALPDGLSFANGVTSIVGDWTCGGTTTVTCELDGTLSAIAGQDTASVSFTVAIDSDVTGDVTNSVTVTSDNADDAENSTDGAATREADLSIAKTHLAGALLAGNDVSYTLSVKNNGPSDYDAAIVVTDTLPAGLVVNSVNVSSAWDCNITTNNTVVTCTLNEGLTDEETAPAITIVATIAPSVKPATVYNNATVAGEDATIVDTNLTNNAANDETVITTSSDVTVSKTGAATLTPGTDTSYVITVKNTGPSNAADVTVTDTLPAGLTAVSMSGTGWTCDEVTFVCTNDDLSVGTSTITVVAHVASSAITGTDLVNKATVAWTGTAGRAETSDTATGTNSAVADLELTKLAVAPTVDAGKNASFTLSVKNNGPSDAVGDIVITDTLPAGMSFVSANSEWICEVDNNNSQIIVCTLDNNAGIVNGGTAPLLTIETAIASDAAAGLITNTATVSSGTTEADAANNTDEAGIAVGQLVDLDIVDTIAGTPRIGDRLSFRLAVHNNGPSDAQDVVVTDLLPVGLTDIDNVGSDARWSCVVGAASSTGTLVTCTLSGTLSSGEDAPALSLNGTVQVEAFPTIRDDANVSTSTPETNAANNADAVAIAVPPMVKLDLTKDHVGKVQAGQTATYVLTITNNGLTAEPNNFTVTDTLPSTLTYKSFTADDGTTCTVTDQIVSCVVTSGLAVGEVSTINLTVDVSKTATGSITNTAAVSTVSEQMATAVVNASDDVAVIPPVVEDVDKLPVTGVEIAGAVLAALTLLILGLSLMMFNRRRKPLHRA